MTRRDKAHLSSTARPTASTYDIVLRALINRHAVVRAHSVAAAASAAAETGWAGGRASAAAVSVSHGRRSQVGISARQRPSVRAGGLQAPQQRNVGRVQKLRTG